MLIGYARVSTREQNMIHQREALVQAGCQRVFEDTASGAHAADRQDHWATLICSCIKTVGRTPNTARGQSMRHQSRILLGSMILGASILAGSMDSEARFIIRELSPEEVAYCEKHIFLTRWICYLSNKIAFIRE